MNIHVIGSASGIGKWFVQTGLRSASSIFAYDTDFRILELFSDHPNVSAAHFDVENAIKGDYLVPAIGQVNTGDVVLVAIPEKYLEQLSELLAFHLPNGVAVGVMTSKQAKPIETVTRIIGQSTVFGLHPLFGPAVSSPHGQTIAVCLSGKRTESIEKLETLLIKSGVCLSHIDSVSHDKAMAYVQGLTHFIFLTFTAALSKSGMPLDELMKVKTPPFQFLNAFASRLMMGSPATYAAIQCSDDAVNVRELFLEISKDLHEKFSSESFQVAEQEILSIREPFSGSEIEEHSQFSVLAVSAAQKLEQSYFESMESSELVVFKTRSDLEFRVGRILKIGSTYVEIEEVLTRIEDQESIEKIPFPFNAIALETYKRMGINVKMSRGMQIKKGNFSIIRGDKSKEWVNKKSLTCTKILQLPNPLNLSEDVFEDWVPTFVTGVVSCEFLEAYKRKGELPKVTLHLTLRPEFEINDVEANIRAICYGFTTSTPPKIN